jgi:hypothetical protein
MHEYGRTEASKLALTFDYPIVNLTMRLDLGSYTMCESTGRPGLRACLHVDGSCRVFLALKIDFR